MVKITHQPPLGHTTISPNQRSHQVEPTEPPNKDAESTPEIEKPFVERRKQNRRKGEGGKRGPYDMRSGRDRRKNSGDHGSVDIDA